MNLKRVVLELERRLDAKVYEHYKKQKETLKACEVYSGMDPWFEHLTSSYQASVEFTNKLDRIYANLERIESTLDSCKKQSGINAYIKRMKYQTEKTRVESIISQVDYHRNQAKCPLYVMLTKKELDKIMDTPEYGL